MKTTKTILLVMVILIGTFALAGCRKRQPKQYGQKIQDHNTTSIDQILKTPEDFDGKTVTIKGKIIQECMTGCWFDVQQNNALIHVDIKPSGFAIPQKVGKDVIVEGNVSLRDGQLNFIGKGVELK
ncbi:MAG: DUF4920 domain-containing protein [Planctomycetes bacterium]|nr:DUF4920 domain-containing protein [Planctomycetota bacterium]